MSSSETLMREALMRKALCAAAACRGKTSPRPTTCALLVRGDEVVTLADSATSSHWEEEALRQAPPGEPGAVLVLPLEPAADRLSGSLADALHRAGVSRVLVGAQRPGEEAGQAVAWMRRLGLEVETDLLAHEVESLNEGWFKHQRTGLPFVLLTLSATLDGKIATATGASQWISCKEVLDKVHRLRNRLDAIAVGSETALVDDPRLTCRLEGGRDPVRVILDGRFRIRPDARVFCQSSPARTLVFTYTDDPARRRSITAKGHEVLVLPPEGGRIPWRRVLEALAQRDLHSVLVEGGAHTAASVLSSGEVDRVVLFFAPLAFGGDGRPMMGELGVREVDEGVRFTDLQVDWVGHDLMLTARVVQEPGRAGA